MSKKVLPTDMIIIALVVFIGTVVLSSLDSDWQYRDTRARQGQSKATEPQSGKASGTKPKQDKQAKPPIVGVWWPAYLVSNWSGWEKQLTHLKQIGVTDLYIDDGNLGYARHKSRLVSTDSGEYVDKVLKAKNPGIRIHIWRQSLYVDKGSKSYKELVKRGAMLGSTNFIDPANDYAMELDKKVTLEVLDKHKGKIAGYNFDYIRYPFADTGYTKAARAKFEAKYGKVKNWPEDVRRDPLAITFAQFKRDLITKHVREVSKAIKAKHPNVIISADVWPEYKNCKYELMQDWPAWKKYVQNFIHMTYVEPNGNEWFERVTRENIRLAKPNTALTGIGNIGEPGAIFNPTHNMIYQMKVAFSSGARGIVVWHDEKRIREEFLTQLKTYLDTGHNAKKAPTGANPVESESERLLRETMHYCDCEMNSN